MVDVLNYRCVDFYKEKHDLLQTTHKVNIQRQNHEAHHPSLKQLVRTGETKGMEIKVKDSQFRYLQI